MAKWLILIGGVLIGAGIVMLALEKLGIPLGRLPGDFRWEGDGRSFHVLNAVSPAFTCSMPFSEYLVERIAERVDR